MEPHVWQGADLLLDVHVQPRAAKNEVVGFHGRQLKIRISAPPVEGKANRHLIAFLAEMFGVARRDVILLAGENSRDKRFKILSPKHLPEFIVGLKAVD
jgi:uncharacterized protein (TIGR00251 family)